MFDEDMEMSPSIPSTEFRESNNIIGYARIEVIGDTLQLKRRLKYRESRRIVYCMMAESLSNNTNLRYRPISVTTCF